MTKFPDVFGALCAPFEAHEVKQRSQAGRSFHYVTARTVQNRLDDTLGPENWWMRFTPGENSVMCELTIRLPDGSTVTKADAGGYAGMADQGDDDKSGFSDSFKRAAVTMGVGRYLYRDGVPAFARGEHGEVDDGPREPQRGRARDDGDRQGEPRRPQGGQRAGNGQDSAPTTGRAFFAWCKKVEEERQVGMVKWASGWGRLQEFPERFVDWSPEQVALGYAEACRKLQTIKPTASEYEEALSN
jgi:hypothetical protein